MFFVLSKLFGIFGQPDNLLLAALVVGAVLLWTRARQVGRRVITASVVIALVIATVPIGNTLLVPLENRFPQRALPDKVDGIVVLGGQVDQRITAARHRPTLKGSGERMTAFVALARLYPHAKLVFTGGSALLDHPEMKEAPVARAFFRQQGLDPARIVFEDRSRNTYENALYTKQLVKPKPGETWVLVTSASHMPRAYGCFSQLGWTMLPYPVDYVTEGVYALTLMYSLGGGLYRLDLALHEWLGLLIYRMYGYTNALFPAPPTG